MSVKDFLDSVVLFCQGSFQYLTLEALRGGGVKVTPLDFFGFKFFLLDLIAN